MVGVAAVLFTDQSVLLVRRNQEPGLGQWSLPGGLVELGESQVEALKREIHEEASLKVEIAGLIGVFDKIIKDPESRIQYHYILVDYWGWFDAGRPLSGSDISETKLVPLERLDALKISAELKETIWKAVTMRNRMVREGTCPLNAYPLNP